MTQEMLYIYESHLAGYYCTLEEQECEVCEQCGDSDGFISSVEQPEVEGAITFLTILIERYSWHLALGRLENNTNYLKDLLDTLVEDAEQLYEDFKKLKLAAQQETEADCNSNGK